MDKRLARQSNRRHCIGPNIVHSADGWGPVIDLLESDPFVDFLSEAEPTDLVIDVRARTVVARGELDFAFAPHLSEAVEILQKLESGDLLLDLSAVTLIDARGIGVVLAASRSQRSVGASLRVTRIRPSVARVFAIAGLARLIPPVWPIW